MLLGDVMDAMFEAGCSSEQMAIVAASLDQRSPAAKRQARYRERRHNESVTKRNGPDHNESVTKRNTSVTEASQSVTGVTPYARVEDNLLPLESAGKVSTLASQAKTRVRPRVRDERFDRFWQIWPNKVEKPYAEKCFAKVANEVDAIIDGVSRYIREKPPDRPWLNPSTFLNRQRWKDVPAPAPTGGANRGKGNLVDAADELIRRVDEAYAGRELRPSNSNAGRAAAVRVLPGLGGQRS